MFLSLDLFNLCFCEHNANYTFCCFSNLYHYICIIVSASKKSIFLFYTKKILHSEMVVCVFLFYSLPVFAVLKCFNLKFPSFISFSFLCCCFFCDTAFHYSHSSFFPSPLLSFPFLKPWEADPLVNVLCHRPIFAALKVLLFWSILPNPSCLILFSLPFLMSFQVVPPLLISAPSFHFIVLCFQILLNQINSSK